MNTSRLRFPRLGWIHHGDMLPDVHIGSMDTPVAYYDYTWMDSFGRPSPVPSLMSHTPGAYSSEAFFFWLGYCFSFAVWSHVAGLPQLAICSG